MNLLFSSQFSNLMTLELNPQNLKEKIKTYLEGIDDLETKLDRVRLFKKDQVAFLQKADLEETLPLPDVFQGLTWVAETVLTTLFQLAQEDVARVYGYPMFKDQSGGMMRAEFTIIGMGKLGGQEIHYESDLDLIFVFSRNGKTVGRSEITNQEFYARLAQKLISYLSVYTLQGIAYKIDTQLRASGNQGALVTSLDAYVTYQRNQAQAWEKQALLKARAVAGDPEFVKTFLPLFHQLVFSSPYPLDLNEEIHRLRQRMEKEIGRETPRRLHYKQGMGGLIDIEFTIQYLQMRFGKIYEPILQTNSLSALEKIQEKNLILKAESEILKNAYLFYRKLETRMELLFGLKDGYIDPESHLLENLAEKMGEKSADDFLEYFHQLRHDVREVYLRILQIRE